jgi:hypothetical protein
LKTKPRGAEEVLVVPCDSTGAKESFVLYNWEQRFTGRRPARTRGYELRVPLRRLSIIFLTFRRPWASFFHSTQFISFICLQFRRLHPTSGRRGENFKKKSQQAWNCWRQLLEFVVKKCLLQLGNIVCYHWELLLQQ